MLRPRQPRLGHELLLLVVLLLWGAGEVEMDLSVLVLDVLLLD